MAAYKSAMRYPGMPALVRAIRVCGSQAALAEAIGVNKHKVGGWLYRAHAVPLEYVADICIAAEDFEHVNPYTLRPDYAPFWNVLAMLLRSTDHFVPELSPTTVQPQDAETVAETVTE